MENLNFKFFSISDINPELVKAKITSHFGWRIHPRTRKKHFHNGIDIAIKEGTPLRAVANAILDWNYHHSGGLQIIQFFTFQKIKIRVGYAHCSWVEKNAKFVEKGTVIAKSGNTGQSTAPHLHLTVAVWERDGWVFIDPLECISWGDAKLV